MKKSIYLTAAAGLLIAVLTLFAFQNCSGPVGPTSSDNTNSSNSTFGIPGAANTSGDLSNTGISNQPVIIAAGGSKASSLYVTILYQGILQRSVTTQELATWAQYINLDYGCTFIAQQVLGSAEFVALIKTLNASAATYDLYKGLLNRPPSVAEQGAATSLYNSYGATASFGPALAANLLSGQEFKNYCSQFEKMKL